jgi:protein-disulfide isomerase
MAEYRLRHLLTHVIAGAVGAGIVLGVQSWTQPASDNGTDSEDEFGTSVRDYLQDNPDVVMNALKKYQANQEQKQAQASKQFVKDNKSDFFNDPNSPVVGNPDGDVTMVEFFDYNCHYCRGVAPDVAKLLADDPKIRMVHKQLPILGPTSIEAAKVALAAHMQSPAIYEAINKGLWAHEGALTDADIEKIARAAGAKWDQILVDKESPAILNEIQANYGIAQKMGLSGTPGFVIGTEVYPGAQGYDQLKGEIATARTASATTAATSAAPPAPTPAAPAAPAPAPTTDTSKTAEPAAAPSPAAPSAPPAADKSPAPKN